MTVAVRALGQVQVGVIVVVCSVSQRIFYFRQLVHRVVAVSCCMIQRIGDRLQQIVGVIGIVRGPRLSTGLPFSLFIDTYYHISFAKFVVICKSLRFSQ